MSYLRLTVLTDELPLVRRALEALGMEDDQPETDQYGDKTDLRWEFRSRPLELLSRLAREGLTAQGSWEGEDVDDGLYDVVICDGWYDTYPFHASEDVVQLEPSGLPSVGHLIYLAGRERDLGNDNKASMLEEVAHLCGELAERKSQP